MYNDNVDSVDNVYICNKLVYILTCCLQIVQHLPRGPQVSKSHRSLGIYIDIYVSK